MTTTNLIFFLFLLTIRGSIEKSNPSSPSYRAAVIELEPLFFANDSARTLNENTNKFVSFIEEASNQNVDIIVFPEFGLTSFYLPEKSDLVHWATTVPNPSHNYKPCDNSSISVSEFLKTIACAAKNNTIVIVINVIEKEVQCSEENCSKDELSFYSTNVVFDHKGQVIARSRNTNWLNKPASLDLPKSSEISTFDTYFGVTFGIVNGYDIIYETPALVLTRELGITEIVHPTAWSSEMPFMTAIQTQAGWAYSEDVNLLAAGYNKLKEGYFGSGIYAGRQGIVKNTMPFSGKNEEILITEVSKKPKRPAITSVSKNDNNDQISFTSDNRKTHIHDELRRRRDLPNLGLKYENFDVFKTKPIFADDSDVEQLNLDKIACEFKVNFIDNEKNSNVTYRYVAFDGSRNFGGANSFDLRICAIVQCADDTIESCGHAKSSSKIFNSIEIKMIYEDDNNETLTIPSTLAADLLPLRNWTFSHDEEEKSSTFISSGQPTQDLVTFGLWGRSFTNGATDSSCRICWQLLFALLIFMVLQNIRNIF